VSNESVFSKTGDVVQDGATRNAEGVGNDATQKNNVEAQTKYTTGE
jgi:hypothetical protein